MTGIVAGDRDFRGEVSAAGGFHGSTATIVGVATSAPADADLGAGECGIWVDETGDTLNFKVKYSDGTTIKSGSVGLT